MRMGGQLDQRNNEQAKRWGIEGRAAKSSLQRTKPSGVTMPQAKAISATLPQVFPAKVRKQGLCVGGLVCARMHLGGCIGPGGADRFPQEMMMRKVNEWMMDVCASVCVMLDLGQW